MSISNFTFSPNSQYLFNRAYSVSLGPPKTSNNVISGQAIDGTPPITFGNIIFPPNANASPLRVRFEIEKMSVGISNKAKIDIYNLSTASRQAIKKGWVIVLYAGYKNVYRQIFVGTILKPMSTRNGSDIITSLECLDGGSSLTLGVLNKSYPANTTLETILTDLQQALGVTPGTILGIPSKVYPNGFAIHGSAAKALNTLLRPLNMQWSIQNGALNILPIKSTLQSQATVISAETGMIGVPSVNADFMQFECLLNPVIGPNSAIQMISENAQINGIYTVKKAKFEGDSHDSKWQLSCECIPAPFYTQQYPSAEGANLSTAVVTA